MRIVVAGGSGFLGSALSTSWADEGHEVVVLARRAPQVSGSAWSGRPGVRTVAWAGSGDGGGWSQHVDDVDTVVNLAGESIAARRWSEAQKARLERSRVEATQALAASIARAARPPRLFVSASAVGYYGSRGDEALVENSSPGTDFLAALTLRWEAEATRAASAQTRVSILRSGLVLGAAGGALPQMLLPFRLGLGGPAGSGRQYMPWIHVADWVSMVKWIVASGHDGPFNVVGPSPVTNREFATTLGRVLSRPAFMTAPAAVLRIVLGEMADALLLASQRAVPQRAQAAGFAFRFPDLKQALADILTRPQD